MSSFSTGIFAHNLHFTSLQLFVKSPAHHLQVLFCANSAICCCSLLETSNKFVSVVCRGHYKVSVCIRYEFFILYGFIRLSTTLWSQWKDSRTPPKEVLQIRWCYFFQACKRGKFNILFTNPFVSRSNELDFQLKD